MKDENKLEFTGERFTPECVREIWYEHYHRYAFARRFVAGKKVLDAACGEGYGSQLLAQNAKQVIGVDIDANTISHAQHKYSSTNLSYQQASCADLPFADASFDLVVSFETLEHLAEQQQMLSEFKRVLNPTGLLIISTPDKQHYADATGFSNKFHVKELYQTEFKDLLDTHWSYQTWYSQAMAFYSVIERHDKHNNIYATDILNQAELQQDKTLITPMYYIVMAANAAETNSVLPDLHVFADSEQSVYQHYNKTIKDYIYLANQHNALLKKQDKWQSIPILGKIIKLFNNR